MIDRKRWVGGNETSESDERSDLASAGRGADVSGPPVLRVRPFFETDERLDRPGARRMAKLWTSDTAKEWRAALPTYEEVIEAPGVKPLPELDRWYRDDLPATIAGRGAPHVTHDELVRTTEWKMARGIWRPRNLALVRGNPPATVERTSAGALAAIPDPKLPIARLAELAGV